jgi:uncharacterized protein YjeT (DUF2065 family)
MRSIAFADFLIGVGILFVLEGLLFAASPAWMRRAMKSALATPDNILRMVGIGGRGPDPDLGGPAVELAGVKKMLRYQRHREWRRTAFRRIEGRLMGVKCPARLLAP